ncbi:glycosyltransferase [candidate division KSB1 bacterium]|nr:glycosyltransferase [candidate division KSB1 bacterium]
MTGHAKKLTLLYVLFHFQHPDVPGSSRHYYLIRELAKKHDITLLSFVKTKVPTHALQEMKKMTTALYLYKTPVTSESKLGIKAPLLFKITKVLAKKHTLKEMKKSIHQLVATGQYDALLFHGINIYPVIKQVRDIPIVADVCDATAHLLRHQLAFTAPSDLMTIVYRYLNIRSYEKRLFKQSPYLAFITNRDGYRATGSTDSFSVVPNGVDTLYWKRKSKPLAVPHLIFMGVMDYGPNEDAILYFSRQVLPLIKKQIPNIRVTIVGKNPSKAITALDEKEHIHITGYVKDVRPYLEKAGIFIAPLRFAAGQQNKVLQAMSMELPVITFSPVREGLVVRKNENPPLLLAKTAQDFAGKVFEVLDNEKQYKHLSVMGRRFVEKNFTWQSSAQQWEAFIYKTLSSGHMRE